MTMTENVQRIAASKESIRQAIIDKGVSVDQAALIDTYADKISEIPSAPPTPTPQYKRMNFAVKINGQYYKLLNQLGDYLLSQSTADAIFLKTDNSLLCMNIYSNVQQQPSPVFIAYLPGTTQQGYIQINNSLNFETIGSYMASNYTYELNFDYENNLIYFNG